MKGFAVPFGPQEYAVTYELTKPNLILEYPTGAETMVPGETETIRWNAYDGDINTFTVEYSADNGATWTIISNNAPASSRSIAWSVPSLVSNNTKVRVSRNGSLLTDQNAINFIILGQPIVTVSNVCEGAVQLNWGAISSASTYDILQLDTDSMKVVGNTSNNFFFITGLDKNKTYYFGVAPKNGTSAGRRSISVSSQPNGGACSLSIFNNDVKVDSILEPNTARQQFTNAGNALKPVKVRIKNLGTVAVNGPVNISYSYAGNTFTEVFNGTIAAGGSSIFTFSTAFTSIPAGFRYDVKSWITLAADPNHLNDTARKTVKYINNDAITSLPLLEGFEAMPVASYEANEMAIGENKYLDFSSDRSKGRARTFVNTGIALAGSRALTLDQTPYDDSTTADSAILNYNLQQFANAQIRFDFFYKNHGQINQPGNKVWIRGNENSTWLEAYDLFLNQAQLADWKKGIININEILANAIPAQTITPTFQIKLGQEGNTSANSPNPVTDIDDGYTFDNLSLSQAFNDVAVAKIISPDTRGCSLSATNPISIRVKNYNNVLLNNLSVSYQINGGTIVTESIPAIAANQSLDYTFTQRANMAAFVDYNINVWVKYGPDSYAANDSILNFSVHNSPTINTYPYYEGFELSNGNYYTKGSRVSWQWGTPNATIINKAANGTKAWVTNLTGNYNDNETSYLLSPCFDLSSLIKPVLSFSHIFDVELDYDYTWVEYSTDGIIWQKLGAVSNGTNWYDNTALTNWRLSNKKWHVASINLPAGLASVRFRFVLSSDAGVTYEGVGIDDIRVHEQSDVAVSPPVMAAVSKLVAGNSWVPFNFGNQANGPWYTLAEVNANGQDLGTVSIQLFPNLTGQSRYTTDQYYLDRNFVIKSTKDPLAPVGLRLYFTDKEANLLIGANGCGSCGSINDAYELGITKYSGNATDENGDLADDLFGQFQLILPANTQIIPHGNGYYAEIAVNSFSEFWLGKALIKPTPLSRCTNEIISFSVSASLGNSFQWQVDNGTGYANINDNINYTGSTANQLNIAGLPTSSTGNKYRCLIDGVAGNENVLRFTSFWNGSADSNWFNASNWSCETVPDQFTDVVIPGGLSRYPTIGNSTAIRSIKLLTAIPVVLSAGAVLDIQGK